MGAARPCTGVGTTNALTVNLENCSGCGVLGWGWQDNAWWLAQSVVVKFPSTGSHTIRVQTREDGVQIDQIVLSDAKYLSAAPGGLKSDTTVVPKASAVTVSSSSTTSTPFSGTPVSLQARFRPLTSTTAAKVPRHDRRQRGQRRKLYRAASRRLAERRGIDARRVPAGLPASI